MLLVARAGDLDEVGFRDQGRLEQYGYGNGSVLVDREVADCLLWRQRQIGKGGTQPRQRIRTAAIHQANEDVVIEGDVLLIQPLDAGQEETCCLMQYLEPAVSRSTSDNTLQLGNEVDRGNTGHPANQFLFRFRTSMSQSGFRA